MQNPNITLQISLQHQKYIRYICFFNSLSKALHTEQEMFLGLVCEPQDRKIN